MFTTENITLVTPFDYLLLKAVAALQVSGGEGRKNGDEVQKNWMMIVK